MSTTMNCDRFMDRLMDYMEQETDDLTRLAMERHAVSCEECGPVLADLRKLRIDAANLPVMKPTRDLWSGIAERIETPVVAIGAAGSTRAARRATVTRWLKVGLMAASLVAAASLGHLSGVMRSASQVAQLPPSADSHLVAMPPAVIPAESPLAPVSEPSPGATTVAQREPAAATPSVARPRTPEVQFALATLTADYDREIARLRTLMNARRDQLDPATVAIIERNLAVIDTAIAESKAAIVRDPASRFLIESLNQSLQMKVELMRTAAVLPSRT
jgi:hypothetical protein